MVFEEDLEEAAEEVVENIEINLEEAKTLNEIPSSKKEVMKKEAKNCLKKDLKKILQDNREYKDEELEELWKDLGGIPVDNNGRLLISWMQWEEGAYREEVWKWFDERHSEGVADLMGIDG